MACDPPTTYIQELPPAEAEDLFGDVIFEQDPIQILNAILPLYINGQVRYRTDGRTDGRTSHVTSLTETASRQYNQWS